MSRPSAFSSARRARWLPLAAVLLAALAVRCGLALVSEGYSSDVACFSAWALRLAEKGPGAFYAPDYFADYPPGYMLLLWPVGLIARALELEAGGKAMGFLICVVPILCDLGLSALLWSIARRRFGEQRALRFAAFAAFCPALLYDTAVWKQVDGVFCLLLVAAFLLLEEKKWLPAAVLYGFALAVKPQALLFGPVLAAAFLAPLLAARQRRPALTALGRGAAGAALALAAVLACALPFWGSQDAGWLWEKYTSTASSYPYASVNGYNLLTLFGANWQPQDAPALGPVTWQMLGAAGIVLATAALVFLSWRSWKAGRFSPLLLAAFYGVAVFTLSHRMHERYIIPALLLVLAAAARWGDKRLLGAFGLLSLSSLVNLAMVLTSNGTEDQFLSSATAVVMIRVVSAVEVAGFALLAWAVFALCRGEAVREYALAAPAVPATPAPQPAWTRKERLALALLTLAVAVVSFWNLGDFTAPQNPLDSDGVTTQVDVELASGATELWVYPGVSWGGSLTVYDEAGNQLASVELSGSTVFQWLKVGLSAPAEGPLTLMVNNAEVMEAAFRDENGAQVAVSSDSALFDEQQLVPDSISYKNSMYFDEIYHGRTAYEHLHGMPVYETTHPPLGKVFIMLGVALFGMTGFGWRVAGAAFGVALVPVLYLFVRRLTRKPAFALFAAVLAAFDTLRFTQSRIATIDIYGTFFILLAAYFMVWYCQSVLEKGVEQSVLPMALAGLAFGLGAASKWTGIYAGAGLAVLYFGVLWQRAKQKPPRLKQEVATAFCGGIVFFVALPLIIYFASYIPYFWREGGFSLAEWWQCQVNMYRYHSGLEATHPYESRWYTWPVSTRPVWYYLASGLPEGMRGTIAALGNLPLWLAALGGLGWCGWRQLSGKGSGATGAVSVLFLAQFLPWVLVSRCTFLYHYFPSLWFAVTALALVAAHFYGRRPALVKGLCIGLAVAAGLFFVCYYPVISGLPVAESYVNALRILPSWMF